MRIIICGSRNWTDEETIEEYIKTLPPHSTIYHGNCRGADKIADRMAKKHGHEVIPVPAPWHRYGYAAGPIRNQSMLERAKIDLVVAFHDDIVNSTGTKDMIDRARKAGVPVQGPIESQEAENNA